MFNMRSPWFCPEPEQKFWQQPQSTPSLSLLSHSCTPFAKGTPSVSCLLPLLIVCLCSSVFMTRS